MKVILNQDVHSLGEEGDVKEVAPGYARNYLIPQKLAAPHTKANLILFENRRAAIAKRKEEKRQEALSLREKLNNLKLTIDVSSGDTGRLFGSVTSANIADELNKLGFVIERKRIELPEHSLKMTGSYRIKIKLYDNNVAEVALEITSPEIRKKEARAQAALAKAAEADQAAPEAGESAGAGEAPAPEEGL
ncbi:MAG: 50S ribosomal protein L9 [Spirochaetales bacterium]|jgi:large subunit ribosomal protein L9|nr:50S ribosomal protein L9 [Spirochaetales bacterium]